MVVKKAPAEYIIASMTAFIGFYAFPLAIPFSHRFGRKVTLATIVLFTALSITTMRIMSTRLPFDAMHPKRIFVIESENVSIPINFSESC
jgi:hypothetical protein